jgi:hypothetical protein
MKSIGMICGYIHIHSNEQIMGLKGSECGQPFCGLTSSEDHLEGLHWKNATLSGLEQQGQTGEHFVCKIPREMLPFSSAKLACCRLQSTLHMLANGLRMTPRSESLSQPKMVLR